MEQPLSIHHRRRVSAVEEVLTMLVNTARARREEAVGGIYSYSEALNRCRDEDARRALRELSNSFALFAKKGFNPKLTSTADIGAVVQLLQKAGCALPEDMLGDRKGTGTPNADKRASHKPSHHIPYEPCRIVRAPEFVWNGIALKTLEKALINPPRMMLVNELRNRLNSVGQAIGIGELVFLQLQAVKLVGQKVTEQVDIDTLHQFIAERRKHEQSVLSRISITRVASAL